VSFVSHFCTWGAVSNRRMERKESSQPPNDTTEHSESITRSISYDRHGFIISNDQSEKNLTSPQQA